MFGNDVVTFVGNTIQIAETFISNNLIKIGSKFLSDLIGENNWRVRAKVIFKLLLL